MINRKSTTQDKAKDYPEASAFFFFWSGAEATVVDSWLDLIREENWEHISLHGDGVRLSSGTALADVDAFCARSSARILQATGFIVKIEEKQHLFFMDLICCRGSSAPWQVPSDNGLDASGDCIVLACVALGLVSPEDAKAYVQAAGPERLTAQQRMYRCYRTVFEKFGLLGHNNFRTTVVGLPVHGATNAETGKMLLHSESHGIPHCVPVQVDREADKVIIWDNSKELTMSVADFNHCV